VRRHIQHYLFPILFIAVAGIFLNAGAKPGFSINATTLSGTAAMPVSRARLEESRLFCKKNKLDTNIAFFADMSIHSGKKRFFIVDLQKSTLISSSLCCHGMGKGSTGETPVFSNENGSYCTSLGKYKTGARAYSQWGIHVHYKMHGLEKTNNKAFDRVVVLHSYDPVSEEEIYPAHLPMGWSLGCPVISNSLMTSIDGLLKHRKKNVLIWIYN
jgi:hypothetical protein